MRTSDAHRGIPAEPRTMTAAARPRTATYLDWERNYKWQAHERWTAALDRDTFRALIKAERFGEVASRAVSTESRTNLLFSFEKMALRDAVKAPRGARAFAEGLYDSYQLSAISYQLSAIRYQ